MTKKKELDYDLVERLASIKCTLEEIAVGLDISHSDARRLSTNDNIFRERMERGYAKARLSLRRLQWRHATGFGPAAVQMAIHLSKHWLGETDKSTIEFDGAIRLEGGGNSSDRLLKGINPLLLAPEERVELSDLCDMVDDKGLLALTDLMRSRFFSLVTKASSNNVIDVEMKDVTPALPAPELKEAA